MTLTQAGTYSLAHPLSRVAGPDERESNLSNTAPHKQMDAFLAGVERRAFVMARAALGHEDDALDAVQDTMLRLVRRYARRPAEEWPALFFRILQNRIVDMQRRGNVRNRVIARPFVRSPDEDDRPDAVASAPGRSGDQPDRQVAAAHALEELQQAVAELPARQQQAFLLRVVEGLDIAQTAAAMACSAGSVKTHYSRALQALRARLGEHW